MWSEEQAMCVTGHRSAEQMRRDYDSLQNRITRETTSRIWNGARTLREPGLSAHATWRNISKERFEIARARSGSRVAWHPPLTIQETLSEFCMTMCARSWRSRRRSWRGFDSRRRWFWEFWDNWRTRSDPRRNGRGLFTSQYSQALCFFRE